MSSRKSRKLATRRDRRKARASKFRRLPKNPGVVGHGSSLSFTHYVRTEHLAVTDVEQSELRKFPTTFRPFAVLEGLLVKEDTMDNLIVDEERKFVKADIASGAVLLRGTGIFVRAQYNGKWGSFDIAELDVKSLNTWINTLTEAGKLRLIHILLGHMGSEASDSNPDV